MKKPGYLLGLLLLLLSCGQDGNSDSNQVHEPDIDTLKQSYEFSGVFTGTTPCADCPGIYTIVELSPDQTFHERLQYMERESEFADSGTWKMKDSIITLTFGTPSQDRYMAMVNDSTVRMLDANRDTISGPLAHHYILRRRDTVIHR